MLRPWTINFTIVGRLIIEVHSSGIHIFLKCRVTSQGQYLQGRLNDMPYFYKASVALLNLLLTNAALVLTLQIFIYCI